MMNFAENENFEAAAKCRDTVKALKSLNEKQNVVASPDTNADIFGFYGDDVAACMSVMYIRNGIVSDKTDFVFNNEAITDSEALGAFLIEHYIDKEYIPKNIILSFELNDEDILAIEDFLFEKYNRKINIRKAERGSFRELADVVKENATEKIRQLKLQNQKDETVLISLAQLLALDSTAEGLEYLCKIKGVGPKVASCILLFACKRYDAFPVDVWMKRVGEKYFGNDPASFSAERFGEFAGIAQQYLFYYERYNSSES